MFCGDRVHNPLPEIIKMAAVDFTTIHASLTQPIKHKDSAIFLQYFPCANVCARFESFRTFLYGFTSIVKVVGRYELWVNVPVSIFSNRG